MNNERFISYKPNSRFVRQYVAYYYFHDLETEGVKDFIYYPGHKNALTIYIESSAQYGPGYSRVYPTPGSGTCFLYSGIQNQIRRAYIKGPFQKIGIVFQALGINHFIKEPLEYYSGHPVNKTFNGFGKAFSRKCEEVFEENTFENRVALLDNYFETFFVGFDKPRLISAVEHIINSDDKVTVAQLTNQLNVNRRTILSDFKKHLCCTAKDFIDIVRFRKVLDQYLLKENKPKLTHLALDNNFYDQAQLINHFRKFTGFNPKRLFRSVEKVGTEDTFWTMEK